MTTGQLEISSNGSGNDILCRKDAGFDGDKKKPEEWQADKFAAFLLMPTALVKKAFFKNYKRTRSYKAISISYKSSRTLLL